MSRCSQYRVLATDISKSLSCQDASPCHEVVDVPVHQVQEELLVTPVIMQKDMDALSMVFFRISHVQSPFVCKGMKPLLLWGPSIDQNHAAMPHAEYCFRIPFLQWGAIGSPTGSADYWSTSSSDCGGGAVGVVRCCPRWFLTLPTETMVSIYYNLFTIYCCSFFWLEISKDGHEMSWMCPQLTSSVRTSGRSHLWQASSKRSSSNSRWAATSMDGQNSVALSLNVL